MSGDVVAVRAVTSWTCGFLVLAMAGIAIPVFCSIIPDAIYAWRRRGEARPTLIFVGIVVALAVLTAYEATLTGSPGTPSTTLWVTLSLLLAVSVGIAAFCSTITRAVRRRREHRKAVDAATQPLARQTGTTGDSAKPAAVDRLNARGAEFLARDWMRYLGAVDAVETPEQRDGGVDVRSREYVAQVKHILAEQTGVEVVRQLYGVAASEGRRALFFSSSGYTRDAVAFASANEIALFIVRYQEGRLVPHGPLAQQHLTDGLRPASRVH